MADSHRTVQALALKEEATYIKDLVKRGGPNPSEYAPLSAWYLRIMASYYRGEISFTSIRVLWEAFGESFTPRTMQGFVVTKPHGYHGDFEVIDRIYTQWVKLEEHLQKWDLWFHQLHAPRAVRNRKVYFHSVLNDMLLARCANRTSVLNVGSGPGRDVWEFLEKTSRADVFFTCLDHDIRALVYARALLADHSGKVDFQHCPILHFSPNRRFDLVWCAGVFDYFDDRVFRIALKRFLRWVADDGQIVLGNFSPYNPTRPIMEFGGWKLIHRSESDLINLAVQSGVDRNRIAIGQEPEGVNIFLHIWNKG